MLIKNKIVALLSVLLISSSANAFAYSEGDYHTPTSKEEIVSYENELLPQLKSERNLQKSTFLETKIKAPLVKFNPDKLKIAQSKYGDGLRDAFVVDSPDSTSVKEAGQYNAGYIYLTTGYINATMSKYSGSYEPDFSDYNVYGLSAVASVYAHEAGHWYYEDSWTWDNQKEPEEISQEVRADKFSLPIIDNVPQFSVGGILIFTNRLGIANKWYQSDGTHPSNQKRWEMAYNYIKNSSNGRVYFENDEHDTNHLLISDKNDQYEFEVYPPNQYNPKTIISEAEQENKTILMNSADRASYVAGSIAWAIKNNAYNSNSIKYVDAHKYFNDLPSNVNATAIIAVSGNKYKIIDWYLSEEYLTTNQKQQLNDYLISLKASYKY